MELVLYYSTGDPRMKKQEMMNEKRSGAYGSEDTQCGPGPGDGSVGYLAGVPGFEKREVLQQPEAEEKIPQITEQMLVMKDFTSRRIDTLLLNLRKAKVPKINLKAIVTEQNAGWSFYHLYEEIGEEHRRMNGGAQ